MLNRRNQGRKKLLMKWLITLLLPSIFQWSANCRFPPKLCLFPLTIYILIVNFNFQIELWQYCKTKRIFYHIKVKATIKHLNFERNIFNFSDLWLSQICMTGEMLFQSSWMVVSPSFSNNKKKIPDLESMDQWI